MKLKQITEVRYITRDWDRSTVKRVVKKLTNGKFVRKNSGPNTFYYNVPDIEYALDNLNVQFGEPATKGHYRTSQGDAAYYMWVVSGWKFKLSAMDMKLEVWPSGDISDKHNHFRDR